MFTPSSVPRARLKLLNHREYRGTQGKLRKTFVFPVSPVAIALSAARLIGSGGFREPRVHSLRRPHADRQVWRLARFAVRRGYGRGGCEGGARARGSATAAS